ncbi:MAG: hypothetical protein KAG28_02920 [Cocleimonas sp.]|nr:hypothetical protein [Cocleimonas sp.]
MIRWMMLGFTALTLFTAAMTYNDLGRKDTNYKEPSSSVRSGSSHNSGGSSSFGGFSSGGFRGGK